MLDVSDEDSAFIAHAKGEFAALGYTPLDQEQEDGPDKWMQENILELLRVFSRQDHSNSSAPYCISMFKKLASFEPLAPIMGTDNEWVDVSDGLWQNKRCSHVFKDADGAWDIDGKIFIDPRGGSYTNRNSRVMIEFPYVPKREYVNVDDNGVPIDK